MEASAQPSNFQIMKPQKGMVLQASMVDALTWGVAAGGSNVHSSSPPLWSHHWDGKVPFPDVPNLTGISTFTRADFSIYASNWPANVPQNSFLVVASAITSNRTLILACSDLRSQTPANTTTIGIFVQPAGDLAPPSIASIIVTTAHPQQCWGGGRLENC